MTPKDVAAVVRGFAPILGEYFTQIGQRLAALEVKEKGLDGKPGAPGERGPAGPEGQPGRDGRDGQPGIPGANGVDGKDGLHGQDGAAGLNGKDGADGLHGKDGLGFDDLDLVFDDTTGWRLRFQRGDQVKDFALAIPFDAGVWQSGRVYPKAAGVTVKGAWWIAQRDTTGRPGDEGSGWRLSVKGGKDGKPGRDGRNGSDV